MIPHKNPTAFRRGSVKRLKKQDNSILIIIGIIAFVVLFGRSDFLGALITTCENFEPPGINDYFTSIQEMGGLVTYDGIYSVMYNNNQTELHKYRSESEMGNIDLIDTENIGCNNLMYSSHLKDNTSQYISLDKRQALLIGDNFMWCNQNNNVLLSSTSSASVFNYLGEYIVCRTEEVEDNYSIGETECIGLRGTFENGQCICIDGTVLEIGDICPDPEEYLTPPETEEEDEEIIEDEEEGREDTSGGYITSPTQTTTPSTPTSSYQADSDDAKNKELLILGLIAVLVMGYSSYHFFEKGPNKGFIRKKKR